MFKVFNITKRLLFCIDTSVWVFPLIFHLICVGNNNRPYTFSLDLLCFRLIFCIDLDGLDLNSYITEEE